MRAMRFYGTGDLRYEDIAAPSAPAPGSALLQVLAAGICGSDIHNFRTGQWIAQLPVTPGHEFCARILALGDDTASGTPADFAVGDRVVVDSRAHCGQCDYCLKGAGNLCRHMGFVGEVCDGGFAEQTVQPLHRLLKVPDDVPDEIAALAEPLGVALRVLKRLEATPGAPILIAGGGPIGGLAAVLASEMDQRPVLLIERNAERAALLQAATGVIPVALDAEAIKQACGGHEVLFCIEATGSAVVLNQLIGCVGSGGRIAMVGLFHGDVPINANALVEREIDLVGCSVFRDEQRIALSLLSRLAPTLRQLISAPIGLEQVSSAYEHLQCGESRTLKTIIKP